jgi:perosamine synthetase
MAQQGLILEHCTQSERIVHFPGACWRCLIAEKPADVARSRGAQSVVVDRQDLQGQEIVSPQTSQTDVDLDRIVVALRAVLPARAGMMGLHEPTFAGREWDYVKECLDTGWVSTAGKFVDRFEVQLAEFTQVRRAVGCVCGTAALHAALVLLGVGRDDEVLVPGLTFVATANAVAYCGAVPHFVDSDAGSLGVDPVRLGAYLADIAEVQDGACRNRRTGRRLAAFVPVHVFGHPVDLDPLVDLARRYRIPMIEDATESLGSTYKGKPVGSWGQMAVLSFNGNKIITTGGGGAILTNDEELGRAAKHLTTTAKLPHRWEFVHDRVGYNYRLPNINAALGCAQLEQLPGFIERKRALAQRYHHALAGIPGVQVITEPAFARSNYWLNGLLLDRAAVDAHDARNRLLELTHAAGMGTRPAWTLMHKLPMYLDCPRMDLRVAEDLEARLINLPSSVTL